MYPTPKKVDWNGNRQFILDWRCFFKKIKFEVKLNSAIDSAFEKFLTFSLFNKRFLTTWLATILTLASTCKPCTRHLWLTWVAYFCTAAELACKVAYWCRTQNKKAPNQNDLIDTIKWVANELQGEEFLKILYSEFENSTQLVLQSTFQTYYSNYGEQACLFTFWKINNWDDWRN